jgi:hypothetical protein
VTGVSAGGSAPDAATPAQPTPEIAIETANTVTGGASDSAPLGGVRRGGALGRGQAARGRAQGAQSPLTARQRAVQEERCRRLVERFTLGEVLSPQDRVFLRNCAAGRANGNR